jgi:hypothetical protein
MELPCHSVEESDQACFCDSTFEERVLVNAPPSISEESPFGGELEKVTNSTTSDSAMYVVHSLEAPSHGAEKTVSNGVSAWNHGASMPQR